MNELAQAMKKVDVETAASDATMQLRATTIKGPGRLPARRASDRRELGSEQLEHLDRMTNAALGKLTMGVSPVSLAMSWFDWTTHLAASPGKQFQLGQKLLDKVQAWNTYALTPRSIATHRPPSTRAGRPSLRA